MKLHFEPFYQNYLDTLGAYHLALNTLSFEQMTFAPKKGIPYSNEALSILSQQAFEIENNPNLLKQIEDYAKTIDKNSLEYKELSYRLTRIDDMKNVPSDIYAKYVKTQADSDMVWHEAKETNDYELFKPYLKAVMEQTLDIISYSKRYTGDSYAIALDQFEQGMTEEKYDQFFNVIKERLVPFIQKVKNSPNQIDDTILHTPISCQRQEHFMQHVMDTLKIDPTRVYLSTTEHPFTSFFSHDDVRITTHYYPDQFLSAILSTVHEYGHALYGLQMDKAFDRTMLIEAVGSAAHESQSRLLENHVGRSYSFWKYLYPTFIEEFPEFSEISLDDFYKMINKAEGSLIRTEADELTYSLHILIRYEIEKEIAKKTVNYDTLPELWADKYEQYLGVRPKDYTTGILQDTHWADGLFGYFPTYALGSAMAAQIFEAMKQEINVDKALEEGHFEIIRDWLAEHVHRYAASKTMMEIVEEVSHKPFDPNIYVDYLIDKYSKIYDLD